MIRKTQKMINRINLNLRSSASCRAVRRDSLQGKQLQRGSCFIGLLNGRCDLGVEVGFLVRMVPCVIGSGNIVGRDSPTGTRLTVRVVHYSFSSSSILSRAAMDRR